MIFGPNSQNKLKTWRRGGEAVEAHAIVVVRPGHVGALSDLGLDSVLVHRHNPLAPWPLSHAINPNKVRSLFSRAHLSKLVF